MSRQLHQRIRNLTVSAMLSALGTVLLAVGAFVEVLDLSAAVLASLLCVYAVIELPRAYPWMIWLATSLASLLLLPQKTPAMFYALFAGFYPILKQYVERLPRLPQYLLKFLTLHASLGAFYLLLRIFLPTELEGGKWMLLATYGLSLVCFVLYDVALTRLITFYLYRLRERFHIK